MKKNLQYTPSTAHKRSINFDSNYKQDYSINLFSPSHRRNNSRLSSKVSNLKQTLDDLISTISDKRDLQKNAVKRVWQVNTEVTDHLSNSQVFDKPYSMNSRDNLSQKNSFKNSGFGDLSTYIQQRNSPSVSRQIENRNQQNIRLKQALNNQMQSTNQLMNQLKKLQRQHQYLKQSSNNNHMSNEYQYQLQQNARLRAQLQRTQKGQFRRQYSLQDLWNEFSQLKQQNQRLRQDTIKMLRKSGQIQKNNRINSYNYVC